MSDHIPMTIRIGGELSLNTLAGLENLVPGDGNLDEAISKGEAFYGEDGDAPWGYDEDLEKFCRKHKLTYLRTTEAKYEYNGEIAFWKPGMKEPIANPATQDGQPYADLATLRHYHSKGKTLAQVIEDLKYFVQDVPPLIVRKKGRKS